MNIILIILVVVAVLGVPILAGIGLALIPSFSTLLSRKIYDIRVWFWRRECDLDNRVFNAILALEKMRKEYDNRRYSEVSRYELIRWLNWPKKYGLLLRIKKESQKYNKKGD